MGESQIHIPGSISGHATARSLLRGREAARALGREALLGALSRSLCSWSGCVAYTYWFGDHKATYTGTPEKAGKGRERVEDLDRYAQRLNEWGQQVRAKGKGPIVAHGLSRYRGSSDAECKERGWLYCDADEVGDWDLLLSSLDDMGASYVAQRSSGHTNEVPKFHLELPLASPLLPPRGEVSDWKERVYRPRLGWLLGVLSELGELGCYQKNPSDYSRLGFDAKTDRLLCLNYIPGRKTSDIPPRDVRYQATQKALAWETLLQETRFTEEPPPPAPIPPRALALSGESTAYGRAALNRLYSDVAWAGKDENRQAKAHNAWKRLYRLSAGAEIAPGDVPQGEASVWNGAVANGSVDEYGEKKMREQQEKARKNADKAGRLTASESTKPRLLIDGGKKIPKIVRNGESKATKEAAKEGLTTITPEMAEAAKNAAKAERAALIVGMNKKHAVAMSGSNAVILTEGWDHEQNRPKVEFWKKQSFELYYQNRRVQLDGNKTVSLARFWLEAFERRQYDGITFSPGLDIPRHFNLWRGFAFKPKKGDWSLFRAHIKDNLCQGNKDYAGYLIAWMADLIQHPCRRTGVSVALKSSDKGTGKGFFCHHFGKLMGTHYRQVTQTRHLVGNFNGHLADCLLLCADEAFWAGDKQAQGVIKGLITEHTTAIERKHQDVIEVPNRLRIIFNSNEDWIVPAGLDERRFFVLEVGSAQKQNRPYFASIEKQLLSGGYKAMLYDLLHMDISGLDLGNVPQTAALLQQKEQSMTTEQRFWYGRLWNGDLADRREWEEWTPTDELYEAYLKESKSVGERRRKVEMDFSREIKRLCPGVDKKQVTVTVWEQFRGEWVRSTARLRSYKFPPLTECRAAFEKAIRMPIDWPVVEIEAGDEG